METENPYASPTAESPQPRRRGRGPWWLRGPGPSAIGLVLWMLPALVGAIIALIAALLR